MDQWDQVMCLEYDRSTSQTNTEDELYSIVRIRTFKEKSESLSKT